MKYIRPSACQVPVIDHTRDHARHDSAKMNVAKQKVQLATATDCCHECILN